MTKIAAMNHKNCAVVCTLYHKTEGCQAPKTNHLHGVKYDECPVKENETDRWLRLKGSK